MIKFISNIRLSSIANIKTNKNSWNPQLWLYAFGKIYDS